MKKKSAITLATKMLVKIFGDDVEATKTIISANMASLGGDKSGDAVIYSALIETRGLVQELLDSIADD